MSWLKLLPLVSATLMDLFSFVPKQLQTWLILQTFCSAFQKKRFYSPEDTPDYSLFMWVCSIKEETHLEKEPI